MGPFGLAPGKSILALVQFLFVVGFVLWRQLRPRPIRLRGTVITSAILIVFFFVVTLWTHVATGNLGSALLADLPGDILGLAIGGYLGFHYGHSMDVHEHPTQGLVRQASWRLVVAWLAIVAVRYVIRFGSVALHLPAAGQISDGLLALALACVIGRNVVLLVRARRLSTALPDSAEPEALVVTRSQERP